MMTQGRYGERRGMERGKGTLTFVPSGGKSFGMLKAQQEARLEEINKVKGRSKGAGPGGRGPWTRGPILALAFSPQQFLDDPKYSSDDDLPSKLETFKSEGKTVGVEGEWGG